MPIALSDGDRMQLRITTQCGDQGAFNILHYSITNSSGGGITQELMADHLNSVLSSLVKGCMSADAEFRGLDLRRLLPSGTSPSIVTTSAGAGTVTGDAAPRQTCGLISKITGLSGRANRGRVYVPFPSVGSNGPDGVPTNTYMTQLDNLAMELDDTQSMTDIGTGGSADGVPVVFHDATGLATAIILCTPRQKWATMRTRGSYGKPNTPPY